MSLYEFGEIACCPRFGPAALVEVVGTEPGDGGVLYHVRRLASRDSPWAATVIVAEGELRGLVEE